MTAASYKQQQPPPEIADERPVMIDDGTTDARQRMIASFAERLFRAYYRALQNLYRAWQTPAEHIPPYTEDRQRLWQKLAAKITAYGITDPEGYISQQFRRGRTMQPAQIVAQRALDEYEKNIADARSLQKAEWKSEATELNVNVAITRRASPTISVEDARYRVLSNVLLGMSPLFRYCVAMHNGHYDLAAIFHDAALQQLLGDLVGYADNWTGKIPHALLDEAAQALGTTLEKSERELK